MENLEYPDEYIYYYDPETGEKRRLKLKNYFPGIPEENWGLSGMKFDVVRQTWTGKTPDSLIPVGAQSSGYYVDEEHFNDPRADNYYRYVIIQNVGETTLKASELLNQAKELISNYQYDEAKKKISTAKSTFDSVRNLNGMKICEELENSIDLIYNEKLNSILKTKRRIHFLILKDKLERCNLFPTNLNSTCNLRAEIKEIIEVPKILGFFMYKFPDEKFDDYAKEINKIFKLIGKTNENPYIRIDLPEEITGLGVKTCEFCRIARAYDFGILLLSPKNVNAYLEAGMFLALGKKVVCLRNKDILSKTPFDLDSFIEICYNSLEDLEKLWNEKLISYFDWLIEEYCKEELEYYFKFYKYQGKECLEIKPKHDYITPFEFRVKKGESGKISDFKFGPSGEVPENTDLLGNLETNDIIEDGVEYTFWRSNYEANPDHSYFIILREMPEEFSIGKPSDLRKYHKSVIS